MVTTDYETQAAYSDNDMTAHDDSSPAVAEPADNYHLQMAYTYLVEFENRINSERPMRDIEARQAYENRSYKRAMLHAVIAAAQAQTRQAEVAESFLEFVAELIDKTDLVNSLLQWGYKQERIG